MAAVWSGGGAWGWFTALGTCLPSFLPLALSADVFNSGGGCAVLLQEALGLPSLLVYGVEGVIFSPIVTWTRIRCAQAGAGLCLIAVDEPAGCSCLRG